MQVLVLVIVVFKLQINSMLELSCDPLRTNNIIINHNSYVSKKCVFIIKSMSPP